MENNMKELTSVVYSNIDKTDRPKPTSTPNEIRFEQGNGAIKHQFDHYTKKERDYFYAIYGKLKELKLKFSKDELNRKLSINDFNAFRELRNKLTFWVKIGLGASRQLEELALPIHKTVPRPPLLTTGYMAKLFELQTKTYLEEIASSRIKFYEPMFLETKKLLTKLNTEIMDLITETSTNQLEIILAKAFRSAVAGSNDLFKSNYREFYQPGGMNPTEPETTTDNVNQYRNRPTRKSYRPLMNIGLPIPHKDRPIPPRHGSNSNEQTTNYTREAPETDNMDVEIEPLTETHHINPPRPHPEEDTNNLPVPKSKLTETNDNRSEKPLMGPPLTGSLGKTLTQTLSETLKHTKPETHASRPATPSTSNLRRGQSQSPSPSPKTRHTLAEIKQRDDTYFNKLSLKQATPNKNNPKANPPSNMTDIPTSASREK